MNERDVNEFLLDTITGLSGDFCQNLRAVQVDVKDNVLITWFYFDGKITDENKRFASITVYNSAEFFSKGYGSKYYIEQLDYPHKIPNNGRFVYLRYEKSITQEIRYNFIGHPLKKLLSAFNGQVDIPISEVFWPPLISLLLNEAFLGCIKPNVRAVKGELDSLEKILHIWVYFEGEISENNRDVMNVAIDKVKAYFNTVFLVKASIDRLDRPQKIPHIGSPIFYGSAWKKSDELGNVNIIKQHVSIYVECCNIFYIMRNIQAALLRRIGSTLRVVKIDIDEMRKVSYFWFYYDGGISQRDRFNVERVMKRGVNPSEFVSNVKIIRVDYPNKIPSMGLSVYERDEQNNVKEIERNISSIIKPHEIFYIKRHIQNAPLEKIGPTLRTIKIEMDELRRILYFQFCYDGEISQKERLNAESVIEDIRSSFGSEFATKDKIICSEYQNKIPLTGVAVYERDEQKVCIEK